MAKKNRFFNWYIVIMLVVLYGIIWYSSKSVPEDSYAKNDFIRDLENDMVLRVEIQPNAETPTGVVSVEKSSGNTSILYVTDVNEIQTLIEKYDVPAYVKDIPRAGWFVTYVLPI